MTPRLNLRALAAGAVIALAYPATCASVASAATGSQVASYATGVERAWAALTNPATGAVTDTIAPGPHATRDFNYGTLQMADAQLRAATRTGDANLAGTALAVINGTIARNGGNAPNDPFNLLAVATLIADGRAGLFPAAAWAQIQAPLEAVAAKVTPPTFHGFADPMVFDNWRLVWAAGAIQLAKAGLLGEPGSISENPAALRAEVARIINEVLPRNGGPVINTPYGKGRALSDNPGQPLPYHLFTSVLIERIYEADPTVFGPAGLAVREQIGNYALTLMAPDGDLTPSGRSIQQSWVLANAADLGAMRANQGGPNAPVWRAFADRAFDRLVRVHGTFADGTIPVVPGLKDTADMAIADHYSSMSQYNGATLFYLQHAADQWPDGVPAGSLTADHAFLASDLANGGPSLTWGRSGNVWWGIQGRQTDQDSRTTQGIVALKIKTATGWRDVLASRPLSSRPKTGWALETSRGTAHLELTRATGTGKHAVMTGSWKIGARAYRAARWDVQVKAGTLVVTTEALRKGEKLTAAVWATHAKRARVSVTGRAAATTSRVSASGRAYALTMTWKQPGRVQVTL